MDEAPNKFAPLTEDEFAAPPTVGPKAPELEDGELASPIPPDAPEPPRSHPKWGKPTARWTYRDANGATLQIVFRFDPPDERKQFLPCTLWRDAKGLRWRWKGLPAPRPLYGLEMLAADPDALVIVCEGEKAVEAARRIFPDSVCVTSPGGANGAQKADWTCLAGRRVLIWPDADEPGMRYEREVATILVPLKCEISVIDAATLAEIDGGRRGPNYSPDGWDAANAVAEWPDLEALRAQALWLTKPFDEGPAYISHGLYHMRADGLWCAAPDKGKNSEDGAIETLEVWVSGPFEILGRVRDHQGDQWARLLRWRDEDGREHVETVDDADLHGDASALAAELARGGLKIATGRGSREKLVAYLNGADVRARATSVDRTGWHLVADSSVFVLPSGPIGAPTCETVILRGGVTAPYGVKGTLEAWRENVGEKTAGHSRAILAVSVAFAGPLLHLTGQDGFGVHLYGSSSRGKTTLVQAAASVWGPPSFVKAWRATANALEASAALATDALLCLDEIGAVEARDAGPAIYALFNGEGKGRARIDGNLRKSKTWRIAALSSGEIPIATKMVEGGKRATAGQSVRMLDIQADAGHGFGCFDHGDGGGDAGPIANGIKYAARDNYGTAGPEFVRRVVADGVDDIADDCRAAVGAFVEAKVPRGADGQVTRVATRFGLVGVAGELATSYGLTSWQPGEAMLAAHEAFAAWVDARGGVDPSETAAAIAAVRHFIEAHGDARFEKVGGEDQRPVINRAGYRKGEGAGREWWCLPEVWKVEICAGLDPVDVAKALANRGMLRPQGDKLQANVRIGVGTIRAYVLKASIIDGVDDAE